MYKSKLQEFCQKKYWQVPLYETSQQGPAHIPTFIATVKVNELTFRTPNACKTSKEAQNQAALLAFQHFSNVDHVLQPGLLAQSNTPKVDHENSETQATLRAGHQILRIGRMYKNELQNYAQVRNLALPAYSSESDGPLHAPRFKAKVSIDGQVFESPEFFSSVKDAQQAAARAALLSLLPDKEEASVLLATDVQEHDQPAVTLPSEPVSKAEDDESISRGAGKRSREPLPEGFASRIVICPRHLFRAIDFEGGIIDKWVAIEFPPE